MAGGTNRVVLTLTWAELGLLRAVIKLKIAEVERNVSLGIADPDDLAGRMKSVKVKLDRPVERLKRKCG